MVLPSYFGHVLFLNWHFTFIDDPLNTFFVVVVHLLRFGVRVIVVPLISQVLQLGIILHAVVLLSQVLILHLGFLLHFLLHSEHLSKFIVCF